MADHVHIWVPVLDPPLDRRLLLEALSVLAGSDPENCSYSKGYVKRQALFVCITCTVSPEDPAGICLACANKCHGGHNILELYTKRNFRCDCGNKKFGEFKCSLIPSKNAENERNQYNHNFHNSYCTCDPLCPEAWAQRGSEMIQCIVCEDWFHSGHLGCPEVEPEGLQEMICEACMNKAPFLWTYAAYFAVPPVGGVGVTEGEEEKKHGSEASGAEKPSNDEKDETKEEAESPSSSCTEKREETNAAGAVACILQELESVGRQRAQRGAVFWPYYWRSQLCTCTSCKRAYVAAQVQFLLDPSDTLLAYEDRGSREPFGYEQHPLLALTESMSHVQQLEVIYGVQEMTAAFSAFFKQCQDENKTVTQDTVRQFFDDFLEKQEGHRSDPEN